VKTNQKAPFLRKINIFLTKCNFIQKICSRYILNYISSFRYHLRTSLSREEVTEIILMAGSGSCPSVAMDSALWPHFLEVQEDWKWFPTAAARVHIWAACGVCGVQSGTGTGFLRVLRFPLPIIPPISPLS
jgi:hypothetical protein